MIVYHGDNLIVDHPVLVRQNRTLDFGPGFYTTTNLNQAVSFAGKVTARSNKGCPYVSMYEIPNLKQLQEKYNVLLFDSADEAWLDFVFSNRNGTYSGLQYDVVYGPVANDTIYRTFAAYEEGILTKEETIARLKIKKLYDQITFKSENVLNELKYIGSYDPKEAVL